jgi:acetyl esterase/lipase
VGASLTWFPELYKPDPLSTLFSSFNDPKGHVGMPPVALMACGMDYLRDEAVVYEERLRLEAGIKTRLTVYSGLPHSFWVFFPELQRSKQFWAEILENARWLLEVATGLA